MILIGDLQNKELSLKVGKLLGVAVIYPDLHIFPDGEIRIRINEEVCGKDILVLKSVSPPVNDNVIQLLFIIDALKRNGADNIFMVVPYLGYMRADHIFRTGEGVPLEVVTGMFESANLNRIMLVDPHSIKTPEIFKIKADCISALPIFADKIKTLNLKEKFTLVSPDMGGIRRIKILSELLDNADYAVVEKERDYETGDVSSSRIAEGKVNKICIIVDDMISSGMTIVEAINTLNREGAEEIYVFATHPVFSGTAAHILQNSKAKKIFVTDTIFTPEEKRSEKLEILSVAEVIVSKIKETDFNALNS